MRLDRAAHLAAIGQFIVAIPCFILAFLSYRLQTRLVAPTTSGIPVVSGGSASMLGPHTITVAIALMAVLILISATLNFLASRQPHVSLDELDKRLAEQRKGIESQIPSIMVNDQLVAGPNHDPKSQLVIHSADYRAIDGEGEEYDVTDCLRPMVKGDSLILQIQNHNFAAGNRNCVPDDPKQGTKKRLRVTYSYNGRERTIERLEDYRLVLPEDSYLKQLTDLFSPLQVEALVFAKDIRAFLEGFEERPSGSSLSEADLLNRRIAWRRRLESTYEARFGDREQKLMLEFGKFGISVKPSAMFGGPRKMEEMIPIRTAAIIVMAYELSGYGLSLKGINEV